MLPRKMEDHRRKWDLEEYKKMATERIIEETEGKDSKKYQLPIRRELLKQRDYKVDLDSKLGKSTVITKSSVNPNTGGYYCNVCDCVVKDSINFLDHINGKKHQRNMGMSMRVERSSVDQVKKRIEENKRKFKEEKVAEMYDFEKRVQELDEEEEKLKEYRRDKRRNKKKMKLNSQEEEGDPDMMALMGFAGFGSSKK